jgi:hypothetical protein
MWLGSGTDGGRSASEETDSLFQSVVFEILAMSLHPARTRSILVCGAAALLAVAALLFSSVHSRGDAPRGSLVSYITEDVFVDRFVIGHDETVVVLNDALIEAVQSIEIHGTLVAEGTDAGGSRGSSVFLTCSGPVLINGSVTAADGSDGTAGREHGGVGGAIVITCPVLVVNGSVRSGSGGDGATDGSGGDGGDIHFCGIEIRGDPWPHHTGQRFRAGHGGRGGPIVTPYEGRGRGGNGGNLSGGMPSRETLRAWQVTDISPEALDKILNDAGITPQIQFIEGLDESDATDVPGHSDMFGFEPSSCIDGIDGTDGSSTSAMAGNGGPGADGPAGSSTESPNGLNGAPGGNGGNAMYDFGVNGRPGAHAKHCCDDPEPGKNGGNGGAGGAVLGGLGGPGGSGGNAFFDPQTLSFVGVGGNGGAGGTGGNSFGGSGGPGGRGGDGSPEGGFGGIGGARGLANGGPGGLGGLAGQGLVSGQAGLPGLSGNAGAGSAGANGRRGEACPD